MINAYNNIIICITIVKSCIPKWTKYPGYKLKDLSGVHNIGPLDGSTITGTQTNQRTYYAKSFTVDSIEKCARLVSRLISFTRVKRQVYITTDSLDQN